MPNDELMELSRVLFAKACMQFSSAFIQAIDCEVIEPVHAANAIYGTVGAIVHNIPDEKWKQMLVSKPCGDPQCNCHKSMDEFMAQLDKVRTKAKEVVERHKGVQSHEM